MAKTALERVETVQHFQDREILRRALLRQPPSIIANRARLKYSQVLDRLKDPSLKKMLAGMSAQRVKSVENLEKELQEHLKDVRLSLQLSVEEMVDVIMSIARDERARDSDRLNAAIEIIDRSRGMDKAHAATPPATMQVFNFAAETMNLVAAVNREVASGQAQTTGKVIDAQRQESRDSDNS